MMIENNRVRNLSAKKLLLPCPCCGGNALMSDPDIFGKVSVFCTKCGLGTAWGRDHDVKIAWNTRQR